MLPRSETDQNQGRDITCRLGMYTMLRASVQGQANAVEHISPERSVPSSFQYVIVPFREHMKRLVFCSAGKSSQLNCEFSSFIVQPDRS